MAIEIVDFPIKNGDFPARYVSSPEGNVSRRCSRVSSPVVQDAHTDHEEELDEILSELWVAVTTQQWLREKHEKHKKK